MLADNAKVGSCLRAWQANLAFPCVTSLRHTAELVFRSLEAKSTEIADNIAV